MLGRFVMFAEIETVIERYLTDRLTLAELRNWHTDNAGQIIATADDATQRLDAELMAGFALLDDGALNANEFREDLRAALLEARALAA